MADLTVEISKRKDQIKKLEKEIQGLEKAQKLVDEALGKSSRRPGRPRKKATRRRRRRSGPSVPDAVEQILESVGKALHVKELEKKLQEMGINIDTQRISSSLQRYIKLGIRFKRPKPGTFALASSSGAKAKKGKKKTGKKAATRKTGKKKASKARTTSSKKSPSKEAVAKKASEKETQKALPPKPEVPSEQAEKALEGSETQV